jgi:hypothetical protein
MLLQLRGFLETGIPIVTAVFCIFRICLPYNR